MAWLYYDIANFYLQVTLLVFVQRFRDNRSVRKLDDKSTNGFKREKVVKQIKIYK